MTENFKWNDRYRDGDLPWDTGRPSSELQRVLGRNAIKPCRAFELGCGTGTNSVCLAQQGFEVTGVDVAPLAMERAKERAQAAGVKVRFVVADALNLADPDETFEFFFDRGAWLNEYQICLLATQMPQRFLVDLQLGESKTP
jgi:SAM-dependent methyltransferase